MQLQFLPLWSLQGGQSDPLPLLRWVHLPQAELPACILQPVKKKKIQFRNWVENISLWWYAFSSHYSWQCLFNSWYIINLRDCSGVGGGEKVFHRYSNCSRSQNLREMSYKEWTATDWFYLQNSQFTNYLASLLNSFSSHRYSQSFYVAHRLLHAMYLGLKATFYGKYMDPHHVCCHVSKLWPLLDSDNPLNSSPGPLKILFCNTKCHIAGLQFTLFLKKCLSQQKES